MSAAVGAVGLAAGGAAVGLVLGGPVGVVLGAAIGGGLGGVTGGYVPVLGDRARARRRERADARAALKALAEPATPGESASLATLLRPDRAVVDFIGRAAELADLQDWSMSAQARSVRVIVGAGGVGKTRLALEIAGEWEAAGRTKVIVRAGHEGGAVQAARGAVTGGVLLVVDYAESRTGLQDMLEAVLADRGPMRVLLLARSLGEWWDSLREESPPAVRLLLDEADPVVLAAAVADLGDEAVAAAAVPFFARALRVPEPPPGSIRFDLPAATAPVLVLHAAALLAVLRSRQDQAGPLRVAGAAGVLNEILDHEARYWRLTARAARLSTDGPVLKDVTAAAALLSAVSLDEAASLVARVPDLAESRKRERSRWARWLYDLYPAEPGGQLGSVQPDLLAETHVTTRLASNEELARDCLHQLPERPASHAMDILARACAHQDAARTLITTALRTELEYLALPAGRTAVQGRADLGPVLAAALLDAPASPDALVRIADGLPSPSVVLADAIMEVTLRVRRSLPDAGPEAAAWADRAGIALSMAGRPGQAATQTREAVSIYRNLAWDHPDRYGPGLAGALDNLGVWLWELGRAADALPVTREAVDVYRGLAGEHPDRYRPGLARALDNLGVWLSELGQPEAALPPTEEALRIRRGLADAAGAAGPAAGPPRDSLADLASSLDNLGVRFSELSDPEAALPPAREAMDIRRDLAARDPDRYRPDLARSLDNMGVRYSEAGDPGRALEVTRQAVDAYGALAADSPGRYRPYLASALDNLALRYSEVGRPDEALPVTEQALEIRRELDAADPGRYRAEIARSLDRLGVRYWELGSASRAIAPAGEAVVLYRDLAARSPDRYQDGLAQALANLGAWLWAAGRPAEARPATVQALDIRRALAAGGHARYSYEMAQSLTNLALIDLEILDPDAALRAIRETLAIYRDPPAGRPDPARVADALGILATALAAVGEADTVEAVRARAEAAEIRAALQARVPAADGTEEGPDR